MLSVSKGHAFNEGIHEEVFLLGAVVLFFYFSCCWRYAVHAFHVVASSFSLSTPFYSSAV
jgi:hypothetical protein